MPVKMPPPEKFIEAWSAIASDRVIFETDPALNMGCALVISSNSQKKYIVQWHDHNYFSNDNATWWQHYPGYPVIAVLTLRGFLPYSSQTGIIFKNVDWHEANHKAHGNYKLALEQIYDSMNISKDIQEKIYNEVETAMTALKNLNIELTRKKLKK